MKHFITFVAIVIAVGSPMAQSIATRQTFVLDLTGPDVERTSGPIETEGRVTSSKPRSPGLEVRLTSMSGSEFRIGDGIVFDVEVTNVGSSPFDFPRSVDLASFVPGAAGNSTALISLQAPREGQHPVMFGTRMLAGSDALPGSLQRLEPGDAMLIRLRSGVSLDGDAFEELVESSARAAIPVSAVVAFDSSPEDVMWLPAVSRNSLPFVLRR
jgi:hypothetical protein